MKLISLILIVLLNFSCATKHIKYDRIKILKKYTADYNIYVDNQRMDFENIYLNKDNVNHVRLDKKNKNIYISQLNQIELIEVKQLYFDSLQNLNKYSNKQKLEILIIVDGYPRKETFKIDLRAKFDLKIVNPKELNQIYGEKSFDGGIIITSK